MNGASAGADKFALAENAEVAYTSLALIFSVRSANVAQLVEQRIRNAWVAGSSPAVGSMKLQVSRLCGWPFSFYVGV